MKDLLIHKIASCHGANESSSVELHADTSTGKTELVIKKIIIERYPITEYESVMSLHENLNRGGGRKLWTLKELC